jgi:tRNA (adenine57-N1/adenine58-N1)-methyltransferase
MKILYSKNGKRFLVKNEDQKYHSQYGFVEKADLQKETGSAVKTNTGHELFVLEPTFLDTFSRIKRGAQIIPSKDVGFIISETGLGKDSVVVDAGAGSGGLCLTLAHLAKKVYSFDVREDHLEIVKKNKELLGLKNLTLKLGSVYEIKLPACDILTLDVPEPWLALTNAETALKPGGFLVSYSPSIPQVSDFCEAVAKLEGFTTLKTVEIMEREWEFAGRKIRPKTQQRINHSGFLTFVRKIKK